MVGKATILAGGRSQQGLDVLLQLGKEGGKATILDGGRSHAIWSDGLSRTVVVKGAILAVGRTHKTHQTGKLSSVGREGDDPRWGTKPTSFRCPPSARHGSGEGHDPRWGTKPRNLVGWVQPHRRREGHDPRWG